MASSITLFGVQVCVVTGRGIISQKTRKALEDPGNNVPFVLGTRMRKVKEMSKEVLSRAGHFKEVHPPGKSSKDLSPFQVREVRPDETRYIVCLNLREAEKDRAEL